MWDKIVIRSNILQLEPLRDGRTRWRVEAHYSDRRNRSFASRIEQVEGTAGDAARLLAKLTQEVADEGGAATEAAEAGRAAERRMAKQLPGQGELFPAA